MIGVAVAVLVVAVAIAIAIVVAIVLVAIAIFFRYICESLTIAIWSTIFFWRHNTLNDLWRSPAAPGRLFGMHSHV